jgi:hypothetical protein
VDKNFHNGLNGDDGNNPLHLIVSLYPHFRHFAYALIPRRLSAQQARFIRITG